MFLVMDPHYEGLVDWVCTPPFLGDASSTPERGAYEKGGVETQNCTAGERCRSTSGGNGHGGGC